METPTLDATLQEKLVQALGRTPLFRLLKPELMPQLLSAAEIVSFAPGETIVRQGENADAFFVLAEGEATISVEGHNGEKRDIGRLPHPSSIGEVGLLLCEPRTATVTAATDVTAAKFKAKAFEQMFLKIPGFGLGLSAGLAQRVQRLSGMVPLPDYDLQEAPPTPEVRRLSASRGVAVTSSIATSAVAGPRTATSSPLPSMSITTRAPPSSTDRQRAGPSSSSTPVFSRSICSGFSWPRTRTAYSRSRPKRGCIMRFASSPLVVKTSNPPVL